MKKIKQSDVTKSEKEYNWLFGLYYGDDFPEVVGVDDDDLGRVFNKCFSKCDGPEIMELDHVPNGEKQTDCMIAAWWSVLKHVMTLKRDRRGDFKSQ